MKRSGGERPAVYSAQDWRGRAWQTESTQTGRGETSSHSKRMRKLRRKK